MDSLPGTFVLAWEDAGEFHRKLDEYAKVLQPANPAEEALVRDTVTARWRIAYVDDRAASRRRSRDSNRRRSYDTLPKLKSQNEPKPQSAGGTTEARASASVQSPALAPVCRNRIALYLRPKNLPILGSRPCLFTISKAVL